jgi:phosphatidylethanolamine/phosphatidyl-N-methylethanolamine N-methyltransferase
VIATRIGAEGGVRGGVEKILMPITCRLGWRTDFAWQRYARWAARSAKVELVERRPLPPLGHFALVCFRKIDPARAHMQQKAA